MRKADYQLLEEAYGATQPSQQDIILWQLQETIDILQEGMFDRLKSDMAGATAGMGKKALGTLGRIGTLGIGGKYNPFNKMVAQGREAGQQARAASLGQSHSGKMTKIMTDLTKQFNAAIDGYMKDMEKQKIVAPGMSNQLTANLKKQFADRMMETQKGVDQMVQSASDTTKVDTNTGKTAGGMDKQQVGGADASADSGLTGAGSAINQNVIQPAAAAVGDAASKAKTAVGDAASNIGNKISTGASNVASSLKAAPGNMVQKAGELTQHVKNAPQNVANRFNAGKSTVGPAKKTNQTVPEAYDEEEEEVHEEEEMIAEHVDPLHVDLPYTHLNESNTQDYANLMQPGWRSNRS